MSGIPVGTISNLRFSVIFYLWWKKMVEIGKVNIWHFSDLSSLSDLSPHLWLLMRAFYLWNIFASGYMLHILNMIKCNALLKWDHCADSLNIILTCSKLLLMSYLEVCWMSLRPSQIQYLLHNLWEHSFVHVGQIIRIFYLYFLELESSKPKGGKKFSIRNPGIIHPY